MDYKKIYEAWLANPYFDEETKAELKAIANDDGEIKERFYKDLEFGTAGLRGVIGAGTNRMNIYTVRKQRRGLQTISTKQVRQHRVLQLLLILVICHRNLQMRRHFAWQQMELRRMCLNLFVQHQSFPMQCVN
jgi:hypothetical protein